jgi:hypothetical protein
VAVVKRFLSAAAVAVVALLVVGARAPKADTFDVSVDTIEGCSCPLFCPCYFGKSTPSHMCEANNVYKFRKGSRYGNVDLSDQMVWLAIDLGGEWHHKPGPGMPTAWLVTTHDKRSTPEQRAAIDKVLDAVFPVTWGSRKSRVDEIQWHDEPMKAHAKLASGAGEITLDKSATLRPDKNKPVVVENLQYWWSASNEGFVLAPSVHRFNAEGHEFSHEQKNGFTIVWTAKGDIKPAAAKAAAP